MRNLMTIWKISMLQLRLDQYLAWQENFKQED